ncbi:Adrenodoxin-like protein [Lachnellula suecica]|uniref:Adrenodoxin-like protein n=1 Tax=Lachnellula suecica TaxID=602035 RepID=A0A8T9CBE3_9HELO|nr:Adrenodoxin-like protein [Lachnellula suecica]
MLATRAAVRTLVGLQKRSPHSLNKSSTAVATRSTRALSSNALLSSRSCLVPSNLAGQSLRKPGQEGSLSVGHRSFSATSTVSHGHIDPPKAGEELYVTFIDKEGDEHKIAVSKGDNLLTIAQAHDIEMEGACEGSCSCSTCHIIVEDEDTFDKIPEATDEENDMLDLAFGLTETSRLGCQIEMTPELNGLRVKLPNATRNLQASDFAKK